MRDIISYIKIVEIPFDGRTRTRTREKLVGRRMQQRKVFLLLKKEELPQKRNTSAVVFKEKENIDIGSERTHKKRRIKQNKTDGRFNTFPARTAHMESGGGEGMGRLYAHQSSDNVDIFRLFSLFRLPILPSCNRFVGPFPFHCPFAFRFAIATICRVSMYSKHTHTHTLCPLFECVQHAEK